MPTTTLLSHVLIAISVCLGLVFLVLALPLTGWRISRKRTRSIEVMREEAEANHEWKQDLFALEREARRRRAAEEIHDSLGDTGLDLVPIVVEGKVLPNADDLAEEYFRSDPLFSHSLPRDMEEELPIAMAAFNCLALQDVLTGVGADIEAEFRDWYDHEGQEMLVAA